MTDTNTTVGNSINRTLDLRNYLFYWLFVPYIVMFLSVLFLAYKRVFNAANSSGVNSTFISIIFVLFIYFLVCHAGVSICRVFFNVYPKSTSSRWLDLIGFWFWLGTLLLFSAYGVFSALLLYIDGPTIMKESLYASKAELQKLENTARSVLEHPDWDKLVLEIQEAKLQLHNAILPLVADSSSHFCGIGEQARHSVQKLTTLLPGFQVTRGDDVDHDCSHRSYFFALQNKYDLMIEGLLDKHPKKADQKIVEKDELLTDITNTVSHNMDLANRGLDKLRDVWTFFPDLSLYRELAKTYSDINGAYSDAYNKLLRFASAETLPVEPALAAPAVEQIASPWRTPDIVIARANRTTTWTFLLIAVLADIVASLLAANVVYVLIVRRALLKFARSAKRVADTDVEYIWRPDPRPQGLP